MSAPTYVNVGIVGGGLMGREVAAAIGRWHALADHPVVPRLTAVCDTSPAALEWFRRVGTVTTLTDDYRVLLADPSIDVLYLAVPHDLHEQLYVEAAAAGKDLLGEKPFGIDLDACERIVAAIDEAGVFARCSSEMPYFPGAQRAFELARSGSLGQLIEAECAFLHSSDLSRSKPLNWKRQSQFCGELGVMGDLGMHVMHVPLRLGWQVTRVYAQLQDLVPERFDASGQLAPCDTWDNATLHCWAEAKGGDVPLTLAMKRIAPGELNTWRLRIVGMDGGVEFSTAEPKTVRRFALADGRQVWQHEQTGSQSTFTTVTGPIFEFGFSDAVLQMWAAFLAERAGVLGEAFGCVTPAEALESHRVFAAASASHEAGQAREPSRHAAAPVL